jgi:hypothetical protein
MARRREPAQKDHDRNTGDGEPQRLGDWQTVEHVELFFVGWVGRCNHQLAVGP